MSDLFEKLNQNINKININGKKWFKSFLTNTQIVGRKGKIQLEIEKLKWELKLKYKNLGLYISNQNATKSITDFSHNSHFKELIGEIDTIKLCIEKLKKNKNKRNID